MSFLILEHQRLTFRLKIEWVLQISMVLEETCYQTDARCDNGIILISIGPVSLSITVFISAASNAQPQFQLEAARQVLHFLFLTKTKTRKKKLCPIYLPQHTLYFVLCRSGGGGVGGGDQNTTPWKIQLSILLNSLSELCLCLRCSPKEVSLSVVFFRSCMLITFPQQIPLLYSVEAPLPHPPSFPCPTSLTSHHSGELSRVARQSGKRFC